MGLGCYNGPRACLVRTTITGVTCDMTWKVTGNPSRFQNERHLLGGMELNYHFDFFFMLLCLSYCWPLFEGEHCCYYVVMDLIHLSYMLNDVVIYYGDFMMIIMVFIW